MWTHLRIRTQLSLIQLIVGGITIGIISTIFIISFSWIINKYVVISTQLQVHEYYTNTNNIMKWQIESAKSILFRSKQQLLKGNQLYQFMQKQNQFLIEQPYDCLLDSQQIPSSEFQSLFCYGIFGYFEQPTLKLQLAKNLSSLLTQVLPMIDMDIDLLFATSGNEQYYSVWPGDPYPNYIPHKREWYSQHIRKASSGEDTYFSNPYLIYPWLLFMITQTTNMTGINGDLDGVFGSDFNLSLIQTFKQNYESFKFSIIDQEGILLMSQYDIQDQQYIYNESLTGLNYESFIQIINLSNGNEFLSNCDSFFENQLCRHNSLFNGDEIILAKNLIRPDLIIVIQSNFEKKKQELELQNNKFQSEFQATANFSLIEAIIICVSSIIINSIIIYYVCDPIHNILKFTNQFIHKDDLSCGNYFNWKVKEFISNTKVNEDLHRLLRAFNRLRKGYKYFQYCQKYKKKRIERIKYPKYDMRQKIKIENIYDSYPYDNFISKSTIFQLQRNIIIIRQKEIRFYESIK